MKVIFIVLHCWLSYSDVVGPQETMINPSQIKYMFNKTQSCLFGCEEVEKSFIAFDQNNNIFCKETTAQILSQIACKQDGICEIEKK